MVRQPRVRTRENVSFAMRAGIEAPGMMPTARTERSGRERVPAFFVLRGLRRRCCSRVAERRTASLAAVRRSWRRTRSWTSPLSTRENCAGCHGGNGRGGAAIALANPVYLAIADDAAIRKVIANGVPGTAMPAFAESAGGMLTDKQIDVITQQIRSRWSKPGILDGANPPSYAAKSAGDPQRGEAAYKTYCESCHGPNGRGGPKGSAITNDSFLALVSDQGLRTVGDRRASRVGCAGLARRRSRQTDVRPGGHRRRRLARLAARSDPGPTIFRSATYTQH